MEFSKTSPAGAPPSPEPAAAPAPAGSADGRETPAERLSQQLQKNRRCFQQGFLTERELREGNLSSLREALLCLDAQGLSTEARRAGENELRKICGLPPLRDVPAELDVPKFGGLLYFRFSLWPEFPAEEDRLNRDFALPVRDGPREETLFFRLGERRDSRSADGVPCTEYRGFGRLPGYEAAEMSLFVSRADPAAAAVLLKLYQDPADPRWDAYYRWAADGQA